MESTFRIFCFLLEFEDFEPEKTKHQRQSIISIRVYNEIYLFFYGTLYWYKGILSKKNTYNLSAIGLAIFLNIVYISIIINVHCVCWWYFSVAVLKVIYLIQETW